MPKLFIESQTFKDRDHTTDPFLVAEYEGCRFINCQLTGADLSDFAFVESSFEGCDLSNAKLAGTAFKSVRFKACKLLGLQFDECNPFLLELGFEACNLSYAVFSTLKLRNTSLVECQLEEADFTAADLTGAVFDRCDLYQAVFKATNLEGADFRSALRFSIDPEANRLRKAKFSAGNIAGLLGKYGISIAP